MDVKTGIFTCGMVVRAMRRFGYGMMWAIACMICANVTAWAAHQVALVGGEYGVHERTSIIRTVLSGEVKYDYVNVGTFLEADDFPEYGLIIITGPVDRPYTNEEHQRIADYVRNGGNILLIKGAPNSMADSSSEAIFHEWAGVARYRYARNGVECVLIDEDPILNGVWEKGQSAPLWTNAEVVGVKVDPQMRVIVGGDPEGKNKDLVLIGHKKYGEGNVYYLAHEQFRLRGANHKANADSDRWVQLVQNIVSVSVGKTLEDIQQEKFSAYLREHGRSFLLWTRPWQREEESGPVFVPALPNSNERITTVSADMAVDEAEAFQVNFSVVGEGGEVSWELNSPTLPAQALRLYVQSAPPPIPWPNNPEIAKESPYWLMAPEYVAPKGRQEFLVGANQTQVLWVKLFTEGVVPGVHKAKLRLKVNGIDAGEVEFVFTVHPVRVPHKRLITLVPYGHVYADVDNVPPALRFKRNLQENGYEWTLINTLRNGNFRIADTGETLNHVSGKKVLNRLLAGEEPELDVSSLDNYINASIDHNLTRFSLNANLVRAADGLAKRMKLEGEEFDLFTQWYMRQVRNHLHDHGIRVLEVRYGDELSETELREKLIPLSERLHRAGWRVGSSFTGLVDKFVEMGDQLAANVSCWTLNRILAPYFLEKIRTGEIRLAPNTLVGTYGAGEGRGTEIRKNLHESRQIGWEAWHWGLDYCAPNPYFKGWLYYVNYKADRGVAGERLVAWLDKDDLDAPMLNSPFMEGIRESMEEGNLAAILNWYLDRLEPLGGKEAAEAARIRNESQQWIGEAGTGAPLYWRHSQYQGKKTKVIKSDIFGYREAKSRLLGLLDQVKPLVQGRVGADLRWNFDLIAENGKPLALLVGERDWVSKLNQVCETESGVTFPVAESLFKNSKAKEFPVVILVGTVDSSAWGQWLQQQGITAPISRSFWIRDWVHQDTGKRIIWIGGSTQKDLDRAIVRFKSFLRAEGNWFVN